MENQNNDTESCCKQAQFTFNSLNTNVNGVG